MIDYVNGSRKVQQKKKMAGQRLNFNTTAPRLRQSAPLSSRTSQLDQEDNGPSRQSVGRLVDRLNRRPLAVSGNEKRSERRSLGYSHRDRATRQNGCRVFPILGAKDVADGKTGGK